MEAIYCIYKVLDRDKKCTTVYLVKGFDTVDHVILLSKLDKMGI